jgi:hypothetical protein
MANTLMIVGIVLVAFALLVVRDLERRKHKTKHKTVDEEIIEIAIDASHSLHQFQELLHKREDLPNLAVSQLKVLIDYYRRLEMLASTPDSSLKEIQTLARETKRYIEEQKLKGIFVDEETERLAQLIQRRNAA